MSIFLESTTPGKHFSLSVYKPQRGPAYALAVEGIAEHNGDRYTTFTTELFGDDRSHRILLGGNATRKNKVNALNAMQDDLEDKGWIPKGQTLSLDF